MKTAQEIREAIQNIKEQKEYYEGCLGQSSNIHKTLEYRDIIHELQSEINTLEWVLNEDEE